MGKKDFVRFVLDMSRKPTKALDLVENVNGK